MIRPLSSSRPLGKSNDASVCPRGQLGAGVTPLESTGDHEVHDDEAAVLERNHDALADPAEAGDDTAGEIGRRGIDRSQHERFQDVDVLERLARDQRIQPLEIHDDIGQLWHRRSLRDGTFACPSCAALAIAGRRGIGR